MRGFRGAVKAGSWALKSGWAFSPVAAGSEGGKMRCLSWLARPRKEGRVVVSAGHQAKRSLNFSGAQFPHVQTTQLSSLFVSISQRQKERVSLSL